MKPLDPRKRQEILDDLAAGHTRNQIARDRAASPSTVTRLANDNGHTFDRSMTEKATRARVADSKAVARQLVSDMLANATRLQARLFESHTYRSASAGRLVEWTQDGPTPADMVKYFTLAGIAISKHVDLLRNDIDEQANNDVDRWLAYMFGGATEDEVRSPDFDIRTIREHQRDAPVTDHQEVSHP